MRILVDMDDVICLWSDALDQAAESAELHRYGYLTAKDRRDFNMYKGLNDEGTVLLNEILNRSGFYTDLEPVPGAIEAVQEMQARGNEVAIVTAPWLGNPACAGEKFDWVHRHFGEEMVENTIITRTKGYVLGDVLIDDKPFVHGTEFATWRHIYFEHWHNTELPGPRINNWTDGTWKDVLF